jgi:hypothetical protein
LQDTAQVKIKVLNSVELIAGISGTEYLCRPYDSVIQRYQHGKYNTMELDIWQRANRYNNQTTHTILFDPG